MNETLDFDGVVNRLSGQGQGEISHTECKKYLRHDHPVLGVDRIVDYDFSVGWVHAVRAISCSDPVFAGHFADAAMYPGTNLTQDINQIGTLLFTAMCGPFKDEVTAFKTISASYGHPVPPGCLIDFAVWATAVGSDKTMHVNFEGRLRDFPFYERPNRVGLTFQSAISGTSVVVRAKRKIYDGIWM